MGYYLADGIYPEWAAFAKLITRPQNDKAKLYAQCQESARKDVERAFGVLQKMLGHHLSSSTTLGKGTAS